MTLIDKNGHRKACDRCHRVRVTIRRGAICEGCREQERKAYEHTKRFLSRAKALRSEIAARQLG